MTLTYRLSLQTSQAERFAELQQQTDIVVIDPGDLVRLEKEDSF